MNAQLSYVAYFPPNHNLNQQNLFHKPDCLYTSDHGYKAVVPYIQG